MMKDYENFERLWEILFIMSTNYGQKCTVHKKNLSMCGVWLAQKSAMLALLYTAISMLHFSNIWILLRSVRKLIQLTHVTKAICFKQVIL